MRVLTKGIVTERDGDVHKVAAACVPPLDLAVTLQTLDEDSKWVVLVDPASDMPYCKAAVAVCDHHLHQHAPQKRS